MQDMVERTDTFQERLQVVTDSGALAMWEVDLSTGGLTWSVHGEKFLGAPPDPNYSTLEDLLRFVHPEDQERIRSTIAECLANKADHCQERFRVVRADGEVRHVSAYVRFVAGEDGALQRMIGMAADITALVDYSQQLRETDERLRATYEAARVWTCRLDLEHWTITRPMQAAGTAPQFAQEQPFSDWLEHVHPEDRARVETGMRKAIATGELWEDEFRLRWPDGNYHWIYDRGRRVQLPGQPDFFTGAAMDIDDRKRVEQRLMENEERLRSAYVAGKMWPWELDVETERVRRSDDLGLYRGPGRFGWNTISEWLDQVHPEDRGRVRAAIEFATKGKGLYSCEYRLLWEDGTYHWLNSRGGLIQDARGTWKLMGMTRDCTEERLTAEALEESERLRLLALDAANMGVFSQDLKSGRIRWSERQYAIYGVTSEDFNGNSDEFRKLVFAEDLRQITQDHERLIASRARHFRIEFRIRRPIDGKVRWIAAVGEVIYDETGKAAAMMGVNYDVTEAKQQEQELRESEKLRSIALGAAEMGVWQQDLSTGKIRWTERQHELFGVTPQEFDGTSESAFKNLHPEDLKRLTKECAELVSAHGTRHVTEFRVMKPGGGVRWLAAVGEILYGDSGESLQSIGVNFDITERKEQDEALRQSERLRRLALSAAHMGAFEWDVRTGEISWSPEQYDLLKFTAGRDKPTLELFEGRVHPEDLPQLRVLMQLLVSKRERRYRNEFRIVWPNGAVRWIRTLGEFTYGADGEVVRMFGVNWDITDQKETEERVSNLNRELQRKVADFEALMNAMPVAVAMGMDAELKDVRVNPTMAQFMGVSDTSQNVSVDAGVPRGYKFQREEEDLPSSELPMHKAVRLRQEVRNQEFELVNGGGERVDMFGHAVPIFDEQGGVRGAVGAYIDITERKRAEQALRTGEKLATAGKMAASLAHEINNPLAAVTNLLYLIAQDEGVSEVSKRYIDMATGEIARVSQITRNILAFYRESNLPVQTDITELMESVLELYAPRVRNESVQLDFQRGGNATVLAFPGELRQVFSNLVLNALDAMPTGGKLRIRVRQYGRRGVRISVADTGTGISREQLRRLFEPFFTTKGEKGTGLGLWVSRDIISKHDGTIVVRSSTRESKRGTCFSVFLPVESLSVKKRAQSKASSATSNSQ